MEDGNSQHRPDVRLVLTRGLPPAAVGCRGILRYARWHFNNANTYLVLSGLTRMRASTT